MLSPVFTVAARNAWDDDPPFGEDTPKKKKKEKERLHFQSLAAKASATKKKLFEEEKEKKDLILGPCTVRPLNIFHFLFYIQKQKKPIHTLIFLFLLKNLPMKNLNLCKTHRLIELLVKITYAYLYS